MLRSLIHFWRLHLAVLLGAAVTATVLTGSLAVGDSMRASLRRLWLERLGNVELAVAAPRFFRAELTDEMARRLAGAAPSMAAAGSAPGARLGAAPGAAQGPARGVTVAPLIVLRGTAVHASLRRRAARIAILGVDQRFAALFPDEAASLRALPGGRGSAVADPPSGPPLGEVGAAGGRTLGASPSGRSEGGSASAAAGATAADGRPVPAGGAPGSAGLTPVILNQTLARQLGARPGDDVLLSWEQPSAIPRELLLAAKDPEEQLATHRFTVAGVVADRGPGSFDLVPGQATPRNAFLPLAELQRELGEEGKANALLVGRLPPDTGVHAAEAALAAGLRLDDLGLVLRPLGTATSGAPPAAGSAGAASPAAGAAAPAGSPRQAATGGGPAFCGLALESREFFLSPAVAAGAAAAAAEVGVAARPVLTYLAIALAAHGREVPYSMVTALGPSSKECRDSRQAAAAPVVASRGTSCWTEARPAPCAGPEAGQPRLVDGAAAPALTGDDILLDSWAAEDLAVRPGDTVEMSWFLPDSGDAGAPLRTGGAAFRVRGIVALAGLAADRSLTPAFPGIDQARDMASWSPPFPVDLHRVRPRDEAYWHRFGPAPKAFVALDAARRRWRSRFGDLTSVRLECAAVPGAGTAGQGGLAEAGSAPLTAAGSASPAAPGSAPLAGSSSAPLTAAGSAPPAATGAEQPAARFEPLLLARLRPADFGLALRPVRAEGLRAAAEGTDFSSLFVSFSSFLIVSAALVTGLLFALGLERRAREIGLLLALGYPPRSVLWRFLGEGLALAGAGALLGAACAGAYAAPLLRGLAPALPEVAASRLAFAISPATLAWGWLASVVTVLVFLVAGMRRMGRLPAARLLAGAVTAGRGDRSRSWRAAALVGSAAVLATLIMAVALRAARGGAPVLAFGVAASLLAAGISAFALWCLAAGERDATRGGLLAMGVRNTAANPRRSLLSVGLVACACLVLVLVAANRRGQASAGPRGWGGWNLVAESATPIYQDLGRREGRAALGFSAEAERALAGSEIAGLTEVPGDDASCLNLYRPRRPRLLGVPPPLARQRFPLAAGEGSLESLFAGAMAKTTVPPEKEGRGSVQQEVPRLATTGAAAAGPQSRHPGWASPSQAAAEAEAMPAVGDEQAVRWVLHLGVGDEITVADAAGVPARLRIAGLLAGSPLQGALLVPEEALARHFPRHGGRSVFLVRTPRGREEAVAGLLGDQLRDFGLEVTPVAERLRLYSRVEDTYLASFEALGALGLLLGTCGLAVVLLRNVVERRWELAALRAFGFRRRRLAAMLLLENVSLLALGLALGTAAGLLPEALGAGLAGSFPWLPLTATLGAVILAGLLASGLAVAVALGAPLLQVLKAER